MGIFGWDLPPGCSIINICPDEGPCEICGKLVDDCICPECSQCGANGDPVCYDRHGLKRSVAQINSMKEYESMMEIERKREAEFENEYRNYE